MSGTIIDTALVPEAIGEVRDDFERGATNILREELEHERFGVFDHFGVPSTVGVVTVARGLSGGGNFVDKLA